MSTSTPEEPWSADDRCTRAGRRVGAGGDGSGRGELVTQGGRRRRVHAVTKPSRETEMSAMMRVIHVQTDPPPALIAPP
ncbi:hypothetical protein [Streptomyces sp. NPDC055134]